MNYSDGGINYHNLLTMLYKTSPEFQRTFMPNYDKFVMNNIIKKLLPEEEHGVLLEKKPQSILEMLMGV